MEPHDIYFALGVFMPLIGLIGYLTARAERTVVWFPSLLIALGLMSLAYTWVQTDGNLTLTGFGDSVVRIIAALF
ncbi:MAG: hypothetical protein JKX71_06810 [Amylibacter sp.]|nr:hypothetical protein [Amylibacter sp.]